MFRLCWRKQVIVPNIDVWPYIIIPCSSMYFCACLSKLLQAIFHFQAKYNEGCSRLLHITIDAVCSIMDIQSVCYSGATGCYTEFFPPPCFLWFSSIEMKNLKVWCEICLQSEIRAKMKEIGDAEKHPEHDCDRGILHTAFSFMIFIIGQRGDRTREKYVVNVMPCMMWCCF